MSLDETHDPARRSWIVEANGHPDFPIQNLPLGVFSLGGEAPRGGVAIGDRIFDLRASLKDGLFTGPAREAAEAGAGAALNDLLALGAPARTALRRRVSDLLIEGSGEQTRLAPLLHRAADCTMHLPARIGDYTDFYAGIAHAMNVGRLFRPDAPLMPNYKYVPIAYHGRASSVRPSGTPVRRPSGQRKPPDQPAPDFGPCRNLDYELELGVWIGPGNALGEPVPIAEAHRHIAGFCLLNDWSARDIQRYETAPLGPFLGKSFGTSIAAWITPLDALTGFRVAPRQHPEPLAQLRESDPPHGLRLDLEVRINGQVVSRPPFAEMYWTYAQMLAHLTSNGSPVRTGDVFASGTVSGPKRGHRGCLLELTWNGAEPLTLGDGSTRTWLEDGDEVVVAATAGHLELGEVRGRVLSMGE
ncbi:MAG: fumarylacetoacetase [Trebonia sp.]